jgi:hypothetical protein
MPNTAVTIDSLQALQITLHFTPQITFDRDFVVRDSVNNFVQLLRGKIFGAEIWINIRLLENTFRCTPADAVNVGKGRFNAFLRGDLNS